jgi:hypothetical protein
VELTIACASNAEFSVLKKCAPASDVLGLALRADGRARGNGYCGFCCLHHGLTPILNTTIVLHRMALKRLPYSSTNVLMNYPSLGNVSTYEIKMKHIELS